MAAQWFKFDKNFDYRPNPTSVVAYKKGMHMPIPEGAATAATDAKVGALSGHQPQAGDVTDGTQEVRLSGATARIADAPKEGGK